MANTSEYRTPQFGLRDFLFYLVPGGIVLVSILVFFGIEDTKVHEFGELSKSLFTILLAYFLGQVIYPITYPLRKLFRPSGEWEKIDRDVFAKAHMRIIEELPAFYVVLVFRDRSFARFASAMVFPTIALAGSFTIRLWGPFQILAIAVAIIGVISAICFVLRFRHYDRRYRNHIVRWIKANSFNG